MMGCRGGGMFPTELGAGATLACTGAGAERGSTGSCRHVGQMVLGLSLVCGVVKYSVAQTCLEND